MALLNEKNLAAEADAGAVSSASRGHEDERGGAGRTGGAGGEAERDAGGADPRACAARDRTGQDGPSAQCGDGGDHGVPSAVGEPAGSAGEGRGDDARGIQRDRRRGQEAEGTCGAGPAQRPRRAALRGWPINPALRRQTGRKKAQRETIGGPRGNGRSPHFFAASVQSAGGQSRLCASLRPLRGAKNAALTHLPLRSCVTSSYRNNVRNKWGPRTCQSRWNLR